MVAMLRLLLAMLLRLLLLLLAMLLLLLLLLPGPGARRWPPRCRGTPAQPGHQRCRCSLAHAHGHTDTLARHWHHRGQAAADALRLSRQLFVRTGCLGIQRRPILRCPRRAHAPPVRATWHLRIDYRVVDHRRGLACSAGRFLHHHLLSRRHQLDAVVGDGTQDRVVHLRALAPAPPRVGVSTRP
jgi:hypothetical protein